MGHQNGRDARVLQNAPHFPPQILAQGRIETGERLVQQQEMGIGGQGPGQRGALLLAARQFGGPAIGQVRQPGQLQHVAGAACRVGAPAVQPEADVALHRQVGKQGIVLKDHADVAALGRHMDPGAVHDPAGHGNRSGFRPGQAGDHAQGCGLATAGRTEQGQDLPLHHIQFGNPDQRGAVKSLAQVPEGQKPRARHTFGTRTVRGGNVAERGADGPTNQVHPGQQLNSFPYGGQFRRVQDGAEQIAGIRQAYDCDVARAGDFIAEQHPDDPQAHLLQPCSVLQWVTAGERDHPRQQNPALDIGLEDAAFDQSIDDHAPDGVALAHEMPDPVSGVIGVGGLTNVIQGVVQQRVANWTRIRHDQFVRIRIDAAFQRQIHQQGPGQDNVQRIGRNARRDVPAFLVQQQQQNLFRKPQHAEPPTDV